MPSGPSRNCASSTRTPGTDSAMTIPRPAAMPKNRGKHKPAGDDDFSRYRSVFEGYKRDGRWDDYFWLATRPKFQVAAVADALGRGAAADGGPLEFLDEALADAIELRRIPDAAALTLDRARWTTHPILQSDHVARDPGGHDAPPGPAGGNPELNA